MTLASPDAHEHTARDAAAPARNGEAAGGWRVAGGRVCCGRLACGRRVVVRARRAAAGRARSTGARRSSAEEEVGDHVEERGDDEREEDEGVQVLLVVARGRAVWPRRLREWRVRRVCLGVRVTSPTRFRPFDVIAGFPERLSGVGRVVCMCVCV